MVPGNSAAGPHMLPNAHKPPKSRHPPDGSARLNGDTRLGSATMEQRDTRGQASTARFKCMHPAGSNEGAHFLRREGRAMARWARQHSAQDDHEGLWDAFCRSHMAEAQATSRASATQGSSADTQATNRASATQGSSCSGVVRAGGAKETVSNPHAGSRDAKGKKRPRQAPNKDALISQNLALLAASNPRGWMDAENIPPPPQRRAQTHIDLEAGKSSR